MPFLPSRLAVWKQRDDSRKRMTPHSYFLRITHSLSNRYKIVTHCVMPGQCAGDEKMNNAQTLPSGRQSHLRQHDPHLRERYRILWKQRKWLPPVEVGGGRTSRYHGKGLHSFICSQWVAPRSGLGKLQGVPSSASRHINAEYEPTRQACYANAV